MLNQLDSYYKYLIFKLTNLQAKLLVNLKKITSAWKNWKKISIVIELGRKPKKANTNSKRGGLSEEDSFLATTNRPKGHLAIELHTWFKKKKKTFGKDQGRA